MSEAAIQQDPQSDSPIRVRKVAAACGAEIEGVDLSKPLDDATFRAIHDAFVEHEVIVFRDQEMTSEDQKAFGRRFGDLTVHPFAPSSDDAPELIVFDNDAETPPWGTDVWHSDETFRAEPPLGTMLRALIVPEWGGDTMYASMSAAYDGLSDRMQQFISGLEAIHDFKPFRQLFGEDADAIRKLREFEDRYPPVAHPVVRTHPVSGRKVLFVNPQFTLGIKGMDEAESRALLELLFHQAEIPEYQYRHHWAPNTLVFWDNRSVQHYAIHDYYPQRRKLERITIKGDRPFSSDPVVDIEVVRSRKGARAISQDLKAGHKPRAE
ncbi:MAG: TauD/TfdA family dioxygenase [Alphaproteobacteria bacterium]|nr:TauD/TfdA family dioxygenase [Alphaproteobacteria bacterium]